MTFTVTPQPNNVPPRVRIDLDTDDPTTPFTELTIYRDGKKIREQPYVGGSPAVAFDYEAPFGVPVTYSATGSVTAYTTLRNETWASLSGWTTYSGSPVVTGSHLSGGAVTRPLAFPTSGRLTSQGLISGSAGNGALLTVGPITLSSSWTTQSITSETGPTKLVTGLNTPFTLIWDAVSMTLSTASGKWSTTRSGGAGTQLLASSTWNTSFVEDFVVSGASGSTPFTASASTTLDVDAAWLIHPSQPSLSIPIEQGASGFDSTLRFIEASSGESKTSSAVSTVHRPIGRRRAVVITSGPRQADEWTLVLGAPIVSQKNSIRAIVDDQTPLLLRIPVDMGWDLPDDWYAVGDVTVARAETPVIDELTLITLPLIPVDEPIVRQGALWTWGDVLLKYATWADVIADNDTWIDVLAGPA